MTVDDAIVSAYREHGFAVIRDCLSRSTIEGLRSAMSDAAWTSRGIPWIDGTPIDGRSITAVHFPHLVEERVVDVAASSPVIDLARRLCASHLRFGDADQATLVQSMYYAKPPGALGQRWHQDERFTPTRDASLVTVWIALDRADEDNGCLLVAPGSHRALALLPHDVHESDGDVVRGEGVEPPRRVEPLVVAPGDVAVLSGYVVHGSHRNTSDQPRRSLVLNYRRSAVPALSGRRCVCGTLLDLGGEPVDGPATPGQGSPPVVLAR